MRLTEEDLVYLVNRTVSLLKEDVKVSEDFWQTLDGSAAGYEKTEVKTEDMPNDDSDSDAEEITDTESGNVSEPEHKENNAPVDDADDSATDVVGTDDNDSAQTKSTTGSQLGQGGDPFSQKIGDSSSESDNGESTDTKNDGWGSSEKLDSVVGGVIDNFKKEVNEARRHQRQ